MRQVVLLLSILLFINRLIYISTAISLILVLNKVYDYRLFLVNMLISILVYLLEGGVWDKLNEEPVKSKLDKYLKMDE